LLPVLQSKFEALAEALHQEVAASSLFPSQLVSPPQQHAKLNAMLMLPANLLFSAW
jgi:hypothetical protein